MPFWGVLLFLVIALRTEERPGRRGWGCSGPHCLRLRQNAPTSLRHRLSIPVLAVNTSSSTAAGSFPVRQLCRRGSSVRSSALLCVRVVLLRTPGAVSGRHGLRRQRRLRPHQASTPLSQAALLRLYPGDGRGPGMLLCQPQHGLRVRYPRHRHLRQRQQILAGFLALGFSRPLSGPHGGSPPGPLGGCMPFVNSSASCWPSAWAPSACFQVAVPFYLLAERKGLRFSLFLLMETAAVAS